MAPLDDGSFQLARPVTGAEAVAAVARLESLAKAIVMRVTAANQLTLLECC